MSEEIKRLVVNKPPLPKTKPIINKPPKESQNLLESGPEPMKLQPRKVSPITTLIAALIIVLSGSLTGFGLSRVLGKSSSSAPEVTGVEESTGQIVGGEVNKGDLLGSKEKDGDLAEGVLVKGGINGEGSHRLLRPGGPSQNVYLTSSVVDLSQLEGHKVKVWGETYAAQTAGWLMDVVTLEVIELNAPKPFEE